MSSLTDERLRKISEKLDAGEEPELITVRELLSWFGAERRGSWIVSQIQLALEEHNLVTDPDFVGAYIDSDIAFTRPAELKPEEDSDEKVQSLPDPTFRIGRLESANSKPISIAPDDSVTKAITLMLANDYSQLPVMTNDRTVKGMISWESIGSRLALGKNISHVRQCMESPHEISADTPLFAAIDRIVEHQYVLIRDREQQISGIVTTSDLSRQFKQLGEPFLLIGEIENYVRRMIQDKFGADEFAAAKDPSDDEREIEHVSDLTFGEYRRLLETNANWSKLDLAIDRTEFIKKLEIVRRIRNDVMHFDPDGIPPSDIKVLHDFVEFLQRLADMDAI